MYLIFYISPHLISIDSKLWHFDNNSILNCFFILTILNFSLFKANISLYNKNKPYDCDTKPDDNFSDAFSVQLLNKLKKISLYSIKWLYKTCKINIYNKKQ